MYELNTILTFGITFGIVIMSIVYTLIRYFYSKEIFYISYSIMQIFSLIFIVSYSQYFNISNHIKELSLLFATLSALVFAIRFYEGSFFPKMNNYKELFLNTAILTLIILSSFYHYILFEYLPYTIIYAILFISVAFNFNQGFKPTLIYVVGWSFFCFILFIFNFKENYQNSGFMDIVLVAFAIEALLFTLSVSYRYNALQKQTESFENMLLQQSKLAKSGEMIANITHQFRQPLNNISYILINIKKQLKKIDQNDNYFNKKILQANEQLEFLSKTIDDFKEFYSPTTKKENFKIKDAIQNAFSVSSAQLKRGNVEFEVEFKVDEEIKIYGVKNQFSQVLLALISNAIDALRDIEKPYIKLTIDSTNAEVIISIEDNAKGIKQNILNRIFEPYFTTKEDGTGLGLYLVKLIIQKSFNGKVEVKNHKEGAIFTLFIEKSI